MTDSSGMSNQTSMVPDFSHEALAQLQIQCDALAAHVDSFLITSSDDRRNAICDALMRFRNTLVLLEKCGAIYVVEELLLLLDADEKGEVEAYSKFGQVLINGADSLSAHVATLQADLMRDSALDMLPLVNDSRACRTVQHKYISSTLQAWWNSNDVASIEALLPRLRLLIEFCKSRNFLSPLVPLYQSCSLITEALVQSFLADGAAIRKLFTELERHIHRSLSAAIPEDLLPADLLRNFLYYVGQLDSSSQTAIELRRRFRLDRVRRVEHDSGLGNTPTIGVGYHLANAVRTSINAETQVLKDWLSQAPTNTEHPHLVRIIVRFSELEPVFKMMGAADALNILQSINADLRSLDTRTRPDEETRLRLAESLIVLDTLLDKSARRSITRHGSTHEFSMKTEDVYIDVATDACLREARICLQAVAGELELALNTSTSRS